jgi:hypothetical protein
MCIVLGMLRIISYPGVNLHSEGHPSLVHVFICHGASSGEAVTIFLLLPAFYRRNEERVQTAAETEAARQAAGLVSPLHSLLSFCLVAGLLARCLPQAAAGAHALHVSMGKMTAHHLLTPVLSRSRTQRATLPTRRT